MRSFLGMLAGATLALLLLPSLLLPAPLIHAQPGGVCPPPQPPSANALKVRIAHFGEGAAEVGEFCAYLVGHAIWPTFIDLGNPRAPGTPARVRAALDEGRVDVLWVSSSTTALLLQGDRGLRLKVVAVTDFLVLHVGTVDRTARLVTDRQFAPAEVAVRQGRSMFFTDLLMAAIKQRPRCLEASIGCTVYPGEGLTARLDAFLRGRPDRTVVLASWAAPPRGPDAVIRALHAGGAFSLVGIPAHVVVAMHGVSGALAAVEIPPAAYGEAQSRPVPTAGVAQILVSSTPREVAATVQALAARINVALLDEDTRVDQPALGTALRMLREVSLALGTLTLHTEYARQLEAHGISPTAPQDEHHRDQGGGTQGGGNR